MRPEQPSITWKSSDKPGALRVLGVNPWIYDFAAYNVWSRPAGLLACLDIFSRTGCDTALLDLMDKGPAPAVWPLQKQTGKGPYPKVHLPKPFVLKDIPRQFSRYGMDRQRAAELLSGLKPGPDLILVTSLMTYWYPGVMTAIRLLRALFPKARICLGGIYATLCFEHACRLGADMVIAGPVEHPENWMRIWKMMGICPPDLPEHAGMVLDASYYHEPEFSILMCSRGCPFQCPYCASSILYPGFRQIDPHVITSHIHTEYERGIRDFCFYDDALLINPDKVLHPVLEYIVEKKYQLRLHAPNALHVRYLSYKTCSLLKEAGLLTIRLGLETSDFNHRRDAKLSREEWRRGIANLIQAGFSRDSMAVYVLAGLPDQSMQEVKKSMKECIDMGIRPELNYYSPIPGTPLFDRAKETSDYPLDEPLFQNTSVWPCVRGGFSWEVRDMVDQLRIDLRPGSNANG